MKEFDNVEMTEEEVDQVAGGLKTVTIERPKDGHTSIPTMDIEEDGGSSNSSFKRESYSHLSVGTQRYPVDPDLHRKIMEHPEIIWY